jgi:hypothetical protein
MRIEIEVKRVTHYLQTLEVTPQEYELLKEIDTAESDDTGEDRKAYELLSEALTGERDCGDRFHVLNVIAV